MIEIFYMNNWCARKHNIIIIWLTSVLYYPHNTGLNTDRIMQGTALSIILNGLLLLLDLGDILVIVVEDHKAFHYSANLLHIASTVLHTKAMVQCNKVKAIQMR